MSSWDLFAEVNSILTEMGGKGSGHHGHKGVKGHRGGSAPSKGLSVRGVGQATPTDVKYVEGVVGRVTQNLPASHLEGFDVQVVRSSGMGKAGKVGQESSHIQIPRRDRSGNPFPKSELESLVRHEIGHQVFKRVLTQSQRENWVEAGKQIRLSTQDPKTRRYFPWLEQASQMRVSKNLRDLSFGGELFAELYDGYYGYKKSAVKELFPARFKRLESIAVEKSDFIISQIESQLALNPEGGWVEMGGPGSGNWGHKGRKGKRGGSAPGKGGGVALGSKLGYKPSDDIVKNALWYAQQDIRNAANELGLTEKDVVDRVEKKLEEDLQQPLAIRRGRRGALGVAEDGRFKTQFETGTSGGYFNPDTRKMAEKNGLGVPEDISNTHRPVYGYFRTNEHHASNYGAVEFVLKDSVKERTTYTIDDSLHGFSTNRQVGGTGVQDKSAWDRTAWRYLRGTKGTSHEVGYIEAQIQGGVSMKDIAKVVIHSSQEYVRRDYGDVMDALKARGLKVEIDDENP